MVKIVNGVSVKTGGRKVGSKNKDIESIRQGLEYVYQGLGGAAGMLEWAETNRDAFYTKLLPRLIPDLSRGSKDDSAPNELTIWLGQIKGLEPASPTAMKTVGGST